MENKVRCLNNGDFQPSNSFQFDRLSGERWWFS
jgi:hypothetical protein